MVQMYAVCVGYTDHPLLLSQEILICETGA
jgi:hypothetical protein